MRLGQLLEELYFGDLSEDSRQIEICGLKSDSRKVTQGDLFFTLQGHMHNGKDFIKDAVSRGALAVVTSHEYDPGEQKNLNVCYLPAEDPRELLDQAAHRFYGNPSEKVTTIGVTGTNGKTTVTYLIESILYAAQQKCGVIGTVNYRWDGHSNEAIQTTPDFIDNQQFLARLVEEHVPYCVMEVSSHALVQERTRGIHFQTAVFTNLTSDHLDYHKTHNDYFSAKARLFTILNIHDTAIINIDDLYGRQLLSMTEARVVTYGIKQPADIMARDIELTISGTSFTLCYASKEVKVQTPLIGMYNIYNILAAVTACLEEKVDLESIRNGIGRLTCIPGRLESVDYGQEFSIFIDYAHTEDALSNVLSAMRQVSQSKIILVFGCGGDRDWSKRLPMGQVASQLADFSIVTSDNPRGEDPQSIIDQITPGFRAGNFEVIVDRREAIKRALQLACGDDIVLIAGKGHETYQTILGERNEFHEREIIGEYLNANG